MAHTGPGRRAGRRGRIAAVLAVVMVAGALSTSALAVAPPSPDPYAWDPLGLVAGSTDLRANSLGDDVWAVWACDLPGGTVAVDTAAVAGVLTAGVVPYFDWLSGGLYRPSFVPAGTVAAVDRNACLAAVRTAAVPATVNGAFVVGDLPSDGGWTNAGRYCPAEGWCAPTPQTYPDNYREVYVDAHAVVGAQPHLVTAVHELGHALHFPHSYSGAGTGTWAEYDNPIDVMSGNTTDRVHPVGTLAFNRYAAGWLAPEWVEVFAGPSRTFTLGPLGSAAPQLLAIPGVSPGMVVAVDVRVRSGYDAALAAGAEGVAVHRIDQRAEACGGYPACTGISRRTTQGVASPAGYAHVLDVGESMTVDGLTIRVTGRTGDLFSVEVSDPVPPVWGDGTVTLTGRGGETVDVAWVPATDNRAVTGYRVLVDGEVREVVGGDRTALTVTGLVAGRSHRLQVEAGDAAGNWTAGPSILLHSVSGPDGIGVHDSSTGGWLLQDPGGTSRAFYFGDPGDLPMVCDWDGDGSDTVGLYRPGNGFLYLRNTNTQGYADVAFFYGIPGDVPVCGDWNGDGVDTPGVYRPSDQRFYLRNTNTLGFADTILLFGNPGDVPYAGDWNGDGVDTVAVYRPSTGTAHALEPGGDVSWYVGSPGDLMAIGDWDGDGRDSFGSFGSGDQAVVFVSPQSAGMRVVALNTPGARPVAGRWG